MVVVRWSIHTSDRSTAAYRRGRRALRFRLIQRKLGGRRVSTLCLRCDPSKTRRNLCKRRKAAPVPRFVPAPAEAICAFAVGASGIRARRYRAALHRNRGASGYSSRDFRRASKIAVGDRVMKRSEAMAAEPLEAADEPGTAERFQRGPGQPPRHSTAASDNASAESERAPGSRGASIRGRCGVSSTVASG